MKIICIECFEYFFSVFLFSFFFLIENSVYRVHSGRYHVFVLLETVRMFEMVTGTCPKAAGVLAYHKLPRIFSIFSIFTNLLHVKNVCSFFSVCNIGYVEENIKIFFYARHAMPFGSFLHEIYRILCCLPKTFHKMPTEKASPFLTPHDVHSFSPFSSCLLAPQFPPPHTQNCSAFIRIKDSKKYKTQQLSSVWQGAEG